MQDLPEHPLHVRLRRVLPRVHDFEHVPGDVERRACLEQDVIRRVAVIAQVCDHNVPRPAGADLGVAGFDLGVAGFDLASLVLPCGRR